MKNKIIVFFSFKAVLIVCLMLFSFGCATPKAIVPMNKANLEQLIQSPPAVVVLIPDKRIRFADRLYRVLAIQVQENYYTFESIWDPGLILGDTFVKTLEKNFNLRTIPLWKNSESNNYQSIVATSEAKIDTILTKARKANSSMPLAVNLHPNAWLSRYLIEYYQKAIPPETIDSLKKDVSTDFVLELSILGISAYNVPPTYIDLIVYARLIRMSDGNVIWFNVGAGRSTIEDINNFSDLEANNLSLLKEHYEKAVLQLFNPNNYEYLLRDFFVK